MVEMRSCEDGEQVVVSGARGRGGGWKASPAVGVVAVVLICISTHPFPLGFPFCWCGCFCGPHRGLGSVQSSREQCLHVPPGLVAQKAGAVQRGSAHPGLPCLPPTPVSTCGSARWVPAIGGQQNQARQFRSEGRTPCKMSSASIALTLQVWFLGRQQPCHQRPC